MHEKMGSSFYPCISLATLLNAMSNEAEIQLKMSIFFVRVREVSFQRTLRMIRLVG